MVHRSDAGRRTTRPHGAQSVLLLSDGHTNQGITEEDAIAEQVQGLSQHGVSTSAFGLGDGFDEDLMGAIASGGDGTLDIDSTPAPKSPPLEVMLLVPEEEGFANGIGGLQTPAHSAGVALLRSLRGLQDHLGRHRLSVPLFCWCNSSFVMAAIPRQSWNLRVTPDDQQLIDRAVSASGLTRTDFVLQSARAAAQQLLVEQAWCTVEQERFSAFQRALDAPAKPNQRLRRTMAAPRPWED